jgi:hypothetical protein
VLRKEQDEEGDGQGNGLSIEDDEGREEDWDVERRKDAEGRDEWRMKQGG